MAPSRTTHPTSRRAKSSADDPRRGPVAPQRGRRRTRREPKNLKPPAVDAPVRRRRRWVERLRRMMFIMLLLAVAAAGGLGYVFSSIPLPEGIPPLQHTTFI